MSWFKVDDHLHSHRKAIKAGTEAMGLWVLAGSWSAAEESDGWVPSYMLPRLAGTAGEELAEKLVAAGLWHNAVTDGEEGYLFRGWADYQPTKEQLEAKRAEARERMRRARDVRANTKRSSGAVRSTRPDPTRPKNTTAADAAEFETWWSSYPRKTGKAAAQTAYAKARKSATAEELEAGLTNARAVWTAERTEAKFIPHPATWLNQGRWADEQPELPAAAAPTRPMITANQCAGRDCPGHRHQWTDGRNTYMCMGA